MRYVNAKKLHNGDEVTVKRTKAVVRVIAVYASERLVELYCDDGCTYAHIEVK